jgi:hypothetical protein
MLHQVSIPTAAYRKTLDILGGERFPCPQYKDITGTKSLTNIDDMTEMGWGMWNLKNL